MMGTPLREFFFISIRSGLFLFFVFVFFGVLVFILFSICFFFLFLCWSFLAYDILCFLAHHAQRLDSFRFQREITTVQKKSQAT